MTDDAPAPEAAPAAPPDPAAILRSRGFVVLLVFAAIVGVIVSFAGWAFLELVHRSQVWVFTDLPDELGFSSTPSWWYLPVLGLAGIVVAFAVVRLPGNGGHVPANGLQMGGTEPNMVPGIALAAFATLALGVVLGPEAPLIAIGAGLAVFSVKLARRDAQPQLLLIMAAAGSFAAISVIFGSPIVAAVLVIEASGLGGPLLSLILIPGLIAAGIGSLVFIGMSNFSGLNTSAYSLVPLQLPHFKGVTWEEIGWTIALGIAGAVLTQIVRRIGLAGAGLAPKKPFVIVPAAGLAVAALAILFAHTTTHPAQEVLFSGQDALPGLVSGAATWSVGALIMVMICKGLAWGVSLGTYRGGPTFPAIYLGAAGGIAASHLPGLSQTAAVAVGMGVMVVAFLKLPLSAIIIATSLTASAGLALGPLIIVGVVVAYLSTLGLEGRLGAEKAPQPVT
ncbi:MAG TPA: chloride channel protein [Acidimicrobiia bacterium]|nr:chloride channel protein [Acidimicrobiia bacterium]